MALKEAKVNDKLQESLLLVIEMLRMGCLHSNWFGGRTWTGTAHLGTDEDKRNMLLVMRVLSIVPLSFKVSFDFYESFHIFHEGIETVPLSVEIFKYIQFFFCRKWDLICLGFFCVD